MKYPLGNDDNALYKEIRIAGKGKAVAGWTDMFCRR